MLLSNLCYFQIYLLQKDYFQQQFLYILLKFVIYLVVPEVFLHFQCFNHKWWVYYRLNGFKLTGMIFFNL